MATAAIFNFVYRLQLARCCIYMHEIWQVNSFYGPTHAHSMKLNKNEIQDGGRRHLGFLHKH